MLRVFDDAGFETRRTLAGRRGRGRARRLAPVADGVDAPRPAGPLAVAASLRAVLRAALGRGHRRVAASWHDRRRALPERSRRGLRRRVYPVNRAASRSAASRATRRSPRCRSPSTWRSSAFPAGRCSTAAREALAAGRQGALRHLGRLCGDGREGAARQDELLALVRAHGARLVRPNRLGIAVRGGRLNATSPAARCPPSGRSRSPPRAAPSGSRSSNRPTRAASGFPASCRSATKPTSRRTTCSSTGRTTGDPVDVPLPRVVR